MNRFLFLSRKATLARHAQVNMAALSILFAILYSTSVQPNQSEAQEDPGKPDISIFTSDDERPILKIEYPWTIITDASIEIRELRGEEDIKDYLIRPLRFRYDSFYYKTKDAVFDMRDRANQIANEESIYAYHRKGWRDFTMLGVRNSLGRRSVTITDVERFEGGQEVANRAVFPFIEDWSLDDQTLQFDIPSPNFARPTSLQIWFMMGGKIVWTETIEWPGVPSETEEE